VNCRKTFGLLARKQTVSGITMTATAQIVDFAKRREGKGAEKSRMFRSENIFLRTRRVV